MRKVLIATEKPFAPIAVEQIRQIVNAQGYRLVLLEKYTTQEELIEAVADVDAMIIRSDEATREVIEAAKNLKIIVRAGAGYDNIDLKACTAKNIVAMNTPGQNANAVAELAFGMMIYLERRGFNGKVGLELKGKKIGMHAFGNIGQNVARIAKGFDMEVYAYDPFVARKQIEVADVKPVGTIEELYSTCDYVSLHIPATPQTIRAINYDLLKLMPKNATLINTARKEIINEEDLIRIMEEHPKFKYISDITPDNARDFIKYEGRYFFTPKKMGAQTEESNINSGVAAAKQIVRFLENGDITFKVN